MLFNVRLVVFALALARNVAGTTDSVFDAQFDHFRPQDDRTLDFVSKPPCFFSREFGRSFGYLSWYSRIRQMRSTTNRADRSTCTSKTWPSAETAALWWTLRRTPAQRCSRTMLATTAGTCPSSEFQIRDPRSEWFARADSSLIYATARPVSAISGS